MILQTIALTLMLIVMGLCIVASVSRRVRESPWCFWPCMICYLLGIAIHLIGRILQ